MDVVSKFELKRSKSLDFIAYSVLKDFDQKNSILRATLHPKMAIDFERNYLEPWNFAKMFHICIIKSQEVSSAYLPIDSIEENKILIMGSSLALS